MNTFPRRYAPAISLLAVLCGLGPKARAADNPPANAAPTVLPEFIVSDSIQTDFSLGKNTYSMDRSQLDLTGQGANSTFDQMLLHTPGVSQDKDGEIHFRGEDAFYQVYLNGVLLPGGIDGFNQEIDPRIIDTVSFKVGALPAQYAFGNYGIIDIQTKSGSTLKGGDLSIYGGSYDTIHPSVSCGGSEGKTAYYFSGGFLHNSLGIENPTPSSRAVHDETNQSKVFGYISHELTDASHLNFIFNASHADFQIPNIPKLTPMVEFQEGAANFPVADSARLNDTQTEQNYYGIVSYQQTLGALSWQLSEVNRYSRVLFRPDVNGDLYFTGVAARVDRDILTNGLQGDFTYRPSKAHVIRGGLLFDTKAAHAKNTVSLFATQGDDIDPATDLSVAKAPPFTLVDQHYKRAYDANAYLQDEWKISDPVTLNYGVRYDWVNAYVNGKQVSPRASIAYEATKDTVLYASYARYFVPPPLESSAPTNVALFNETTLLGDGAVDLRKDSPALPADNPAQPERSHYFDLGLTHEFSSNLEAGLNAYYKRATNHLDNGQEFGAANIVTPFNYAKASIYGVEVSIDYAHHGFYAYANLAASQAWVRTIVSSQFNFDPALLDYVATHNVHLDQTQFLTGSGGVSYMWARTKVHADALYGSGQRHGFANQDKLPSYYTVNCGIEQRIKAARSMDIAVRFDVINLFDRVYQINDGSGIGAGASKYGNRRGLYGGITCDF
jgi:outer membrane receptor protein involved in Fe transport